jgi:oxygen-independent coproporphyrinogen-3 oxidase
MRPSRKIVERGDEAAGLYIHVPFCKTKCPYCDFYSVTDLTLVEEWLSALTREMEFYKDTFNTFDTLYLGGGTPTVLNNTVLASLFRELCKKFSFKDNAEITVEANPDDVTLEKLELLKELGVNRLSIGVQSFNDEELTFLKRRHSLKGVEEALGRMKKVGFKNFGIDLIYGLPRQTVASWMASLRKALTFGPTHLSCYQLTLEKSTPFGKMENQGKFKVCSEKQGRNFFITTSKLLEQNGFIHYEISNFSKGRIYRSRHNCKYWHHNPYLGLGPAAHSFQNGMRWWNHRSIKRYCTDLQKGLLPLEESETLTSEQLRLEKLFLGLRTNEGIKFEDAFPSSQANASLDTMVKNRLITVQGGRIIPTKKGFLMADRLPLLFP